MRRVHPAENPNAVAVEQVGALLGRLPPSDRAPLLVFDVGYDSAQLTQALDGARAAILVRLRADRCFDADPPPAVPSPKGGRPRRHGAKFDCASPETWPAPAAEHAVEDEQYGRVRVRAWAGLHPKQQAHPNRGTRKPRPLVRGTVVLVEVDRLPARPSKPRVLLAQAGPGAPDLDVLWRAYVRRFDLEHTLRFAKQGLGWTTPRVRHPEQADRWTWLVLVADTQLRLARPWVADRRLPWERPLDPAKLTPSRVRRALSALLPVVGTPAKAPKPCGRSRGGPEGTGPGVPPGTRPSRKPLDAPATLPAPHGLPASPRRPRSPLRLNHKLSAAGGLGEDLAAAGHGESVPLQVEGLFPGRDAGVADVHAPIVSKQGSEGK